MYTIKIEGLDVFANHGVKNEEKILGQKFIISANIVVNKSNKVDDNIQNTINYSAVCDDIYYLTSTINCDLIETLAEKIVSFILDKYGDIFKIRVKVSKPWAPIKKVIQNLSVEVERCRRKVCLSIGSNIEPKKQYLDYAVKRLSHETRISNLRVSNYINTRPVGNIAQDDFLNAAIVCDTYMEPYEMLELINEIENDAGRVRDKIWGPRTLDIDIILYGEICMNEQDLTIPHGEMNKRLFVLEPLLEIAPYMYNPVERKNIREMYNEIIKLQNREIR